MTRVLPTWLFVLPWDVHHTGGVNQVVMSLYRECERAGRMRPLIMVLDPTGSSIDEAELRGFNCIHLRVNAPAHNGITARGVLSYLAHLPSTVYRLLRLFRRYRVEVVNAHYPTLSIYSIAWMKRLGLFTGRLILSFHGLDVRTANQRVGVERGLWRRLIAQADALVACSQSLAADIEAWGPAQRARCVTVRNGVDIARVHELAAPQPPSTVLPTGPFLLNIATFEHKKGQDILLRAYARLAAGSAVIPLVIIGRAGPLKAEIPALIETLGLSDRVSCFYDLPHSRTLEYLRAATLFVLPSRAEGMPIVILEAGALGVPVIATRVDGVPEIISGERLGWLVESEDVDGLEKGLRTLLEDASLRGAFAAALHEHIESHFTWTSSWDRYFQLLEPTKASKQAPRQAPDEA